MTDAQELENVFINFQNDITAVNVQRSKELQQEVIAEYVEQLQSKLAEARMDESKKVTENAIALLKTVATMHDWSEVGKKLAKYHNDRLAELEDK